MKTFLLSLIAAVVIAGVSLIAVQERITLSAPETVPNNLKYRLERFTVQLDNPNTAGVDESLVTIQLIGVEREIPNSCVYRPASTPSAGTVWNGANGMNRRDFSTVYAGNGTTGAMVQALFHRLVILGDSLSICDRPITGSLTGNPQ